jgi:opacity protein-like surface antigen
VLGLAFFAGSAAAQLVNLPVITYPAGYSGLMIRADFGTGLNNDAKISVDKQPMAIGGMVGIGSKMFNVNVGAAYLNTRDPELKKPIEFGGNVGVTVLNKAEMPVAVNVFAGAGYVAIKDTTSGSPSVKVLNIPFGVGIAFKPPMSGDVGVDIWAAPRGQYFSQDASSLPGEEKVNRFGFGVSGGVNVNLVQGVGFYAALDWSTFASKTTSLFTYDKMSPLYFGGGISYKFALPGM